jgi:hypothetical protein
MIYDELFKQCSSITVENENHINSGCLFHENECSFSPRNARHTPFMGMQMATSKKTL